MHNAWSVVEFVVLLVLGIAAVQALIWIPIIMWWRRRARAAKVRMAAAVEGEATIRPAEKGVYRGATAPGYPVVNNSGTIALTDRRLIFITITGKVIDIPCAEIIGVREANVFKAAVRGGRSHLIVQIPTGEIAFYVSSNADWINAIRTVGSGRPT
ncbi:MAG TPA: hypothetical protein VN856_01350 [Mycobacterium sp.]|uniref:hypothetical protein n=1 Tax=Mycobacterium sp. TaxID=1785 RepID=UPI002C45FCCF|nr:hypothetical protein [Mycobacterium sp.]HXO78512.1 hypothetical protein [Mycobacterium sp.]